MTSKEAAWRHPVHGRMVVLPDGYIMTGAKAIEQGWKIEAWPDNLPKTATAHPHDKDQVVIARGAKADRAAAVKAGFTIDESVASVSANTANSAQAAHRAWRSAVLCLPEARERESAAVEIVTSHTEHTMPVINARAFLRGLPVETNESEEPTMSTSENPERAARLAEIGRGATAFNKSRGYGERAAAPSKAAPSLNGVDPIKLKRLAEIRLGALESQTAHEASANETKLLRYALQVHGETGLPLASVFAQLRVDTSKLKI